MFTFLMNMGRAARQLVASHAQLGFHSEQDPGWHPSHLGCPYIARILARLPCQWQESDPLPPLGVWAKYQNVQ